MNRFKLSSKIAYRYLVARKSVQAINIISYISVFAVLVLTAAMIILLSVFNGLEKMIDELYQGFYPPVKVSPASGKWLDLEESTIDSIGKVKGIDVVSRSAEDMVLIFRENNQRIATLKGVDDHWFDVNQFSPFVSEGNKDFKGIDSASHPALLGINIAADVGINVRNPLASLQLYYPREYTQGHQLEQSLSSIYITPSGSFNQKEFDSRYILVPLSTAQTLFDNGALVSSIEIKLKAGSNAKEVIRDLKTLLGNKVKVQDRFEQNKALYMVMRSEKLAIYLIMTFVLIIACFTMVGVLSMIGIDKKKDMSVLRSMGARDNMIKHIFLLKGLLLSLTGGIIGLSAGILICLGQQRFGWVKFNEFDPNSENYPVSIQAGDIVTILCIVMAVGLLSAYLPAIKAKRQKIDFREE